MRSIASWLLLILMLCIGTFLIFGCQKKGPSTEVPTPISYRYTVYWGVDYFRCIFQTDSISIDPQTRNLTAPMREMICVFSSENMKPGTLLIISPPYAIVDRLGTMEMEEPEVRR